MITSCGYTRLLVVYENIDNGMDFLSLEKTAESETYEIVKNNCDYQVACVPQIHVAPIFFLFAMFIIKNVF